MTKLSRSSASLFVATLFSCFAFQVRAQQPQPPPQQARPSAQDYEKTIQNKIMNPFDQAAGLPDKNSRDSGHAFSTMSTPTPPPPPFQQGSNQLPPSQPNAQPPASGGSVVTVDPESLGTTLYASVETSMGSFKVELFTSLAPKTVKNFTTLANGQHPFTDVKTGQKVTRPFYDNLIFHKVIKAFVIQTGCPFGTGKGGPGYTIADEFTPSLRFDKPGVVAMANTGKDTSGSQFFITLKKSPELDDKYTIFGQVISGMDVVTKISEVKVGPTDRPLHRVYVKSIKISQD